MMSSENNLTENLWDATKVGSGLYGGLLLQHHLIQGRANLGKSAGNEGAARIRRVAADAQLVDGLALDKSGVRWANN